jgi:hypothetical protein
MWDPEHFPGADNVPWPLLIRARFQFEVDAVVASTLVRNVARLVPDAVGREFAAVAVKAVASSREVNGRKKISTRSATMGAMMELDDWCGTRWPRWPGPRPKDDNPIPDPLVIGLADRGLAVLDSLGGGPLQEQLSGALQGIAAGNIG